MSDVHDATYYGKCMVGGIFACGITHAAVCPLDIVKCRRQVSYFFSLSTLAHFSILHETPSLFLTEKAYKIYLHRLTLPSTSQFLTASK